MEFLDEAEIAKLSKEDRLAYHRSLKAYRDRINTEEYARSEGVKQGMEMGMEKGMEMGMAARNREIAKNLLVKGFDWDAVMEATGLTPEELSTIEVQP